MHCSYACFFSDDNSFAVWVNNNELALGKTCTVYFNANGHGTAPESQKVAEGDKVKKPSNLTDSGWTFGGWYKEAACTNEWKFDTDAVSGDTTLYAKWTSEDPGVTMKTYKLTGVADNDHQRKKTVQ